MCPFGNPQLNPSGVGPSVLWGLLFPWGPPVLQLAAPLLRNGAAGSGERPPEETQRKRATKRCDRGTGVHKKQACWKNVIRLLINVS